MPAVAKFERNAIPFTEAKAIFTQRFTMEHVPKWTKTPRPDGLYPAPQFKSDSDWYNNSRFSTDKRVGRCEINNPTFPLGKYLNTPYFPSYRKTMSMAISGAMIGPKGWTKIAKGLDDQQVEGLVNLLASRCGEQTKQRLRVRLRMGVQNQGIYDRIVLVDARQIGPPFYIPGQDYVYEITLIRKLILK